MAHGVFALGLWVDERESGMRRQSAAACISSLTSPGWPQFPSIPYHMPAAQSVPDSLAAFGAIVITGASSGIGAEFLKTIATLNPKARFFNLSRTPPTISLPDGRLRHCPADLATASGQEAAATAAEQWLATDGSAQGILLLNNSGFGSYGEFPEPNLERTLSMIDLNVRAPVLLTGRLLSRLRERGGAVINIASTAAFQPTPLMSVYGATKAFLMNWSLGLWREMRGSNVHVLCVCPGPTASNFFRAAGFARSPLPMGLGQTAEQVVAESLRALAARRPLVVCGLSNKLAVMMSGRIPRALVTCLTYNVMAKVRLEEMNRQRSTASKSRQ
jgi:uncharacterized protein